MSLPSIGFGTSPYRPNGDLLDVEQSIRAALAAGFRLFDTAEAYGNELAVGRALRSADAPPRQELSLIGKVWRTNFRPEHLRRACEDSLHRLGIETFDLYLLHAPDAWRHVAPLEDAEVIGWEELTRRGMPREENGEPALDSVPLDETWEAMLQLVSAGLATTVGVSNFTSAQIASLGSADPAANEIACWPLDEGALEWQARHGVALLGYSPLQRTLLDAPRIRDVASSRGCSPAQVILRWLMQRGIRPLTSSTDPEHIRESIAAVGLELDPEEMTAVASAVSAAAA